MSNQLSPRSQYHLELLLQLQQRLQRASEALSQDTLTALEDVIQALQQKTPSAYELGQDWLSNIATHQPQLVPAIDRDIFWFFGGSCLHTLTDEEIERFQQLDEQEAEAEVQQQPFDRASARQQLFNDIQSGQAAQDS